jgi:hypothetical protein
MVAFYRALVALADSDANTADETLADGWRWCDRNMNTYHGVRCLGLKGALAVLGDEFEPGWRGCRDPGRTIDRALDWAMASGVVHAEWHMHIIRAEQDLRTGDGAGLDPETARYALNAFLGTSPSKGMVQMREPELASLVGLERLYELNSPDCLAEQRRNFWNTVANLRSIAPLESIDGIEDASSKDEVWAVMDTIAARRVFRWGPFTVPIQ